MNITFRLETPDDYYAVEEMTREAFWRFWEPEHKMVICDEHLLVHKLRESPCFVPELDYIAIADSKIAGHIIYTESRIEDENGTNHTTLTFGPLTVLPELQGCGIGKALMLHTFEVAKDLGYQAVLILGHPDYYPRAGFRRAADFGITLAGGLTFDAFMVYPLYEGALDGISGTYHSDPIYEQLTQEEALEFDKRFPPKTPYKPIPIDTLLDRLEPGAADAIKKLEIPTLDVLRTRSERDIRSRDGIDDKAIDTICAVMKEHGYRWGEGIVGIVQKMTSENT